MSVQILDGGDIAALYCDTSGAAFGPTFDSAEHAADFCRWLADGHADRDGLTTSWFHSADPRLYRDANLYQHHALWRSERVDEETGALLPVPEVVVG